MINRGKARWAAQRANSLEQQASALVEVAADWRVRRRSRAGADHLRAEAARFRKLAQRFGGAA